MSQFSNIVKVLSATRISDWRLSFVPFIIGCVYFWASLLHLDFSFFHFLIFCLSICTSFGFAALGYFINEFFDKKHDAQAGKINKLAILTWPKQLFLFLLILVLCFAPWLVLPTSRFSIILITIEILCFLLYSLPFIRLKNTYYFAGILDASYAYLVPAMLSFHTFSLLRLDYPPIAQINFFFALLFFIGYRNILIHQINDVLGDIKAKSKSLVQKLGVDRTRLLLQLLLFVELSLVFSFSLSLLFVSYKYIFIVLTLLAYLIYHRKDFLNIIKPEAFLSLKKERHLLDLFYQLYFPLLSLGYLLSIDFRWLILLPLHLLILVKKDYLKNFFDTAWHQNVRPLLSLVLNYIIFWVFLMLGINLKKEKKSALEYFQTKNKDK